MAIYVVSDVHTDYPVNLQWVEDLSSERYKNDTLILPGDITDNLGKLERTLRVFCAKFKHVCFCPGNHELWLSKEDKENNILTSFAKFDRVLELCKEIGITTSTLVVGEVTIVPLFSWHDNSLYIANPNTVTDLNLWSDTFRCVWPENMTREEIAKHFIDLNNKHLPNPADCDKIITFSHFLPSKTIMTKYVEELTRLHELKKAAALAAGNPLPERKEKWPNFSLVAGTHLLEAQILALQPMIHIFGHSHRKMVFKVDNTTYHNQPLGYPTERNANLIPGPFEPFQIYP